MDERQNARLYPSDLGDGGMFAELAVYARAAMGMVSIDRSLGNPAAPAHLDGARNYLEGRLYVPSSRASF